MSERMNPYSICAYCYRPAEFTVSDHMHTEFVCSRHKLVAIAAACQQPGCVKVQSLKVNDALPRAR